MPSIFDAKEGMVDKWNKKEGDYFKSGEPICIITLEGLTVAIDGPRDGILSEIIVKEGSSAAVGSTIAKFANTLEEYLEFRESLRLANHDQVLLDNLNEINEEISKKPDNKTLLREIKYLIQNGDIDDNSDFAKKLQSLARKGDAELLAVFEASFDARGYDRSTFDKKFFLDNANDLIKELDNKNEKLNNKND